MTWEKWIFDVATTVVIIPVILIVMAIIMMVRIPSKTKKDEEDQ